MIAKFSDITLTDYTQLVKVVEHAHGFVFRGQADAEWPLSSSLERAIQDHEPLMKGAELNEYWMLNEFRQKYHLYANHSPEYDNKFEWLALLQHHGCPTRLLDFSNSPYVAAYFAVAAARQDAAIWAIYDIEARERMAKKFSLPYEPGKKLRDEVNNLHIDTINQIIANTDKPSPKAHLVSLSSNKWSERLARQQGVFLAPADLGKSNRPKTFMDNLYATFVDEPIEDIGFIEQDADAVLSHLEIEFEPAVMCLKMRIPKSLHGTFRKHLRMMGITDESLFPGLDGLARSMGHRLRK
ncbi:FRG domain-containing protein [Bordetella bronchiseptica]|uniref:FRG domain-containing protein n=2 Tax=Bordetella bronchiseptica TaxID=518 RepID=UPI000461649B|nr:FRG domain-containing protein [Bordetella bronchiseptica]KDC60102.1 FRG domain protein [Bordetella bronchiseptica MBORD595]